jgi:acetyl esterase/lipase
MGNVYVGLAAVSELVIDLDAVIISVGYRLSTEVFGTGTIEGCSASFIWMSKNLGAFNIEPARFMISGVLAGAGFLAAGNCASISRPKRPSRLRPAVSFAPF